MLTNGTKRRIDTARDILVGKLPDPKSQVEQITIALIYKFMDDMDKQSEELGGKSKFFTGEYAKYAWSKIFDPHVSGHELVGLYAEAIQRMNHNPNIPQLFRDIFKNAYLPYRDPETLKSFLKSIGEFEYDHSEKLGDAFEYLLSVMGSQGDAGQFRTPRHIIDFIVKVVDPGKNETILDPACGTAGFLISSYKHILEKNKKDSRINLTPAQKKRLIENFSGYDISPDMVRLSLVNMYLHGFKNPKIYEYDTLTSEEKWQEVFDVILANPPFMSPKGGIRPHKRFSVQAKRSEVLFVDYITEHLNPNGRAGIIVPEGIIFQSGTAYKKLRKMLVDHTLYAVVSLPAGVFNPYSGVKTSILMLDKNLAKKTNKILFIKINNDGFGLGAQRREIEGSNLPLALETIKRYKQSIIENKEFEFNSDEAKIDSLVEKTKIAESGDYNLSGDRYKEILIYSGKWPIVELGDIAIDMKDGGTPYRKHNEYFGGDIYWCVVKDIKPEIWDTAEKLTKEGLKNSSAKVWPAESIIISLGASIGNVGIAKVPTATKQGLSGIVVDKNKILPKFLFYILVSQKERIKSFASGVTIKEVRPSGLKKLLTFPLPPIEIQEQIVAELDNYQKIIDGAKQIVENYKPTFKINPDWEMVELEKICDPEYGYSEIAKDSGEYRYIRITDISDSGLLRNDEFKYVDLNKKSKNYILHKKDVLVARTGATYGKTLYFDEDMKAIFAGYLIRLNFDKDRINNKFYWIFAQSLHYEKQKSSLVQGGGQPQFNANAIKRIIVPIPPLEIQEQIIAQIEKEQKAVEASKELIMIFEQKIKDKISDVWGEKTV